MKGGGKANVSVYFEEKRLRVKVNQREEEKEEKEERKEEKEEKEERREEKEEFLEVKDLGCGKWFFLSLLFSSSTSLLTREKREMGEMEIEMREMGEMEIEKREVELELRVEREQFKQTTKKVIKTDQYSWKGKTITLGANTNNYKLDNGNKLSPNPSHSSFFISDFCIFSYNDNSNNTSNNTSHNTSNNSSNICYTCPPKPSYPPEEVDGERVVEEVRGLCSVEDLLNYQTNLQENALLSIPQTQKIKGKGRVLSKLEGESRVVVCHDMKGGYLEDAKALGEEGESAYSAYIFNNWWMVDTYLSLSPSLSTSNLFQTSKKVYLFFSPFCDNPSKRMGRNMSQAQCGSIRDAYNRMERRVDCFLPQRERKSC